ncbi:MAG: 3-phosphoshikimate 1-carboxyvinyltransferase [Vulcanisaeta sp.]|nr:3-phosphoshikimate 1-carboxyvinyltransferase [Vulcanisaeta sp.]MCG2892286.1 3-phosphoshikimate 1-carboxyvinyltransferase [Vulcanisaeta sp.]
MGKLIINGFNPGEKTINAPPSKAFTLRYLLASALSRARVTLRGLNWGDDTWSMIRGIKPISEVEIGSKYVRVRRGIELDRFRVIDVGESGFTFRALTGVYSGIEGTTFLIPRGSLTNRPMDDLINALRSINARVDRLGPVVRVVGSRLVGGYVAISGSVSSQYVSSLLYLAPLTEGGIEIYVKPPIKSRLYINATLLVLREFGVRAEVEGDTIYVPGSQEYRATNEEVVIPGDYALSAFYIVLAALAGIDLEITGLYRDRAVEGEYAFVNYARDMGVEIEERGGSLIVRGSLTRELRPITVDLSDSPDIAMPLALLMARSRGRSRMTGVEHLAYKESNRLRTMAEVLRCLGASVTVDEAGGVMEIEGVNEFAGGCEVDPQGDHRIIAMGVIGGSLARKPVVIMGWEGITKSWPTFTWELERLGVRISYA